MTGVHIRGGIGHTDRHAQNGDDVKTQEEDSTPKTEERGLEQVLPA